MGRQKKDGHFINLYIKQELWDEIDRYSMESRIPKTSIVEAALEDFFKKQKKSSTQDIYK
ncbi:MAG: ribbon-helix-helix domain-containing protein [Lachnospiraceae bacterium]|nr:ribbon-helix-helix domain-containing protein [Lachnospiraceae bacterium]